jgi:hypothetical protein
VDIALGQHLEAKLHRFDQAGGVRKAFVLRLQFLPFLGAETKRIQFLNLPVQLLPLGFQDFGIGLQRQTLLPDVLPVTECRRNVARQIGGAGVAVQQVALGGPAQQRLVRMLAVDIHQEFADLLELQHRGRTAVDVRARAARRLDHPAHQAHAVIAAEIISAQVIGNGRRFVGREFRAHFSLVLSLTHLPRLGAAAQHHGQRVDQDGLARAGFAGQHGEAGLEFEIEFVNDDEVANAEAAQHWVQ